MRRTGFLAIVATVMFGTATAASAAESTHTTQNSAMCRPQLESLQGKQTALSNLQTAQAEGEARRKQLRSDAFELAVQIEVLRTDGAPKAVVDALVTTRAQMVADIKRSQTLVPALALQINALTPDVDAASRTYIACVEAALES